MNRLTLPALVASLAFLSAPAAAQGDELITVTAFDGIMRAIDPLTGTTLRAVQIVTSNSINAGGCNGLAWDAGNSRLFVLVKEGTSSVRKLAILNPVTGAATIIGSTSDSFAGLAVRADGVLFAVTGDGANTPESLYTLNSSTAASTFVRTLGAGSDGETIAFGIDGYLYHASGLSTHAFERIDTFANTVTNIPLSGYAYSEMLSLTEWAGGNFLGIDLNDDILVINSSGVVTQIATTNGTNPAVSVKGAAFVPSPSSQPYIRTYGFGCAAASGKIPLLAGRISALSPSGSTAFLDLILAPANSAGLLGFGLGNGGIPVPSATCPIQINPILPDFIPFTTSANGTWSLVVPLPAVLGSGDLFLQTGIADTSGLVLSNPVWVHFP